MINNMRRMGRVGGMKKVRMRGMRGMRGMRRRARTRMMRMMRRMRKREMMTIHIKRAMVRELPAGPAARLPPPPGRDGLRAFAAIHRQTSGEKIPTGGEKSEERSRLREASEVRALPPPLASSTGPGESSRGRCRPHQQIWGRFWAV